MCPSTLYPRPFAPVPYPSTLIPPPYPEREEVVLHKDLIVWQKSHALTLKTIKAVDEVKRSYAGEIAVKQLLRAVTSIGANIAEGYGRYEGKEYARFLQIAYGSANEADNWLIVMRDPRLIDIELANELIRDNEEILKMLGTMIPRIRKKGAGGIKETVAEKENCK
jgi:four helix bundle protein